MIRGVTTNLAGAGFNAASSGRLSVPVAQASVIYSHFKHVSGVAASEGQSGASISKLKILDTLIDRLSQLKKSNSDDVSFRIDRKGSDSRLDVLIEQFQNQIKQLSAASAAIPYKPNPAIAAGTFVDMKV
ncbi:MAG: hypothetical protein Ta2G_21910 [Termitinemataceae bacterium]|nr:MAG: hypothetical protein Ta2G_21910 [Termitinemataceae bacterium]